MASSPIFRRITLTEVKKTSNKRGSLLKELATLEKEEREILKNHHDPSYSNWRASFLIEDGMNTSGFMQSTLTAQGDTNLETIEGNVETSYQAYEGGSDALSNTAITSSGTGSGTDGGFDLGKDYLGFNGNSTPRYAALKPIDATKYDTIVLTGIRGNDSNGGEDPDAADEDLMVYYQLPGQTTIQRLDYSGGVQQSGVDYKIIPVGSGDGTLKDWSIGLPSYARAENIRFILYQPTHHGTGFDNYGVTEINYQRRAPLTVFVSLDSPEASAFIRVGSPSKASQSKKQREKQLREQLEASKDYTDKKFGENFPGSTTPAPGEEDPTEQEKRAPRLGEFEPEVVDYNTWKQETEEENPQAKTSEKEYKKYQKDQEEKAFSRLRADQELQKTAEVLQTAPDNWDPVAEYGPGSKADAQQMDNYLNSLPAGVLDDLKNPAKPDHNLLNLMLSMTAGGQVINKLGAAARAIERFWNKGKDARVKGEDTASWKDLWKDDKAQLGRSDANFQAGKPGNPFGRPDQAFNPFRPADKGGFFSAPTPLVRQVGGRLTKPGIKDFNTFMGDATPRGGMQLNNLAATEQEQEGVVQNMQNAMTSLATDIGDKLTDTESGLVSLHPGVSNGSMYTAALAGDLLTSIITGLPTEIKITDAGAADFASQMDPEQFSTAVTFGQSTPMDAQNTINPVDKTDQVVSGAWAIQGGSTFNFNPDTGMLEIVSNKTLRTDSGGESVIRNDDGRIVGFTDIPTPSPARVEQITAELLKNPIVDKFMGGLANLHGWVTGTSDLHEPQGYNNAWDVMKDSPQYEEFIKEVGKVAVGLAAGTVQGTASNAYALRQALLGLGMPKSEIEEMGGAVGQVGSKAEIPLDKLKEVNPKAYEELIKKAEQEGYILKDGKLEKDTEIKGEAGDVLWADDPTMEKNPDTGVWQEIDWDERLKNLPSWFSTYGPPKIVELENGVKGIFGLNFSGGGTFLTPASDRGERGAVDSGYGTPGYDMATNTGGTLWSGLNSDDVDAYVGGFGPDPFGPKDGPPKPELDRETGDPGTRKPPEVPRDEITSMAPPEGWPTDPDAYVDFEIQQKTGGAVDSVDPAAYPGGYQEKYNNDPEFAARMDALDADIEKFSGEEAAARKELRNLAIKFGWDVATTIFGGFVIGGAVRAVQGITAMNRLAKAAQLAKTLRATQGLSKAEAASKANLIINQAMKIPITKNMAASGLSTKLDDAANALWSSMHKSTDPATKAAANALVKAMETGSDDAVNAVMKAIEKDVYGYGQSVLKSAASVVDDLVIKGANSFDDVVANMENLQTSMNKTYQTLLKTNKQVAGEYGSVGRDMLEMLKRLRQYPNDATTLRNFNSALKRMGEIAASVGLTMGGAIAGEHDLELAQNLEDQEREKLEAEFEAAYEENPEFFDEKFDLFFNSAEEKEFDVEATKLYDELKVAKKVGKEEAEKAKMDAYRAYNAAKWGGYTDDKGKWIPNPDASADKGWLAGGTEDLFKRAEMPEEYKEYKKIMKELGKQASTSKGDLAWAEEQPAAKEARKVYDDYQKVLDKLSDERAAAYDAIVSFLQALPPHPIHKGILDCDLDCISKKIDLENAAKEAAAKEDEGYDTRESLWKSYISTRNSLKDDRMSLWNKKNEIYNKAQDKVKEMIEELKKSWEDAKKNATKPQPTTKEDEIQAQIDDFRDQQRVRIEAFMMQTMAEYYASEGMQPPEGYGDPDSDEYFEFDLFSSPEQAGGMDSLTGAFPEDPASDADTSLGAEDGDLLAYGDNMGVGGSVLAAMFALGILKGGYQILKDLPKSKIFQLYQRNKKQIDDHINANQASNQAKKLVPQKDFGSFADLYGGQGVDAATLASVAAQTQGSRPKKKKLSRTPIGAPTSGMQTPGGMQPSTGGRGKPPTGVKPIKKSLSRTPMGSRPQTNLPTGGRGSAPTPVATQTQGSQGVKPIKPMKPIKKKLVRSSYKPNGSIIIEKRQLKSPNQFFNQDDIKPDYPKDPPPEMVNNYHPDLADGEKISQRFNKLDPASAKAMPKTGNPHIDAKVEKAKNNPDKDGPAWHKKVTDKIRKTRAQQRTGTGQSNGDDSNGNGGEG